MAEALEAFRGAILAALGHAPEAIEPGRLHRFATSERRSDDAGWCKLFDDMRGGVFGCHRQGVSETWSAIDRTPMTRTHRAELARQFTAARAERDAQQRQQWAENAQRIAEVWARCLPLTAGDLVTQYLSRRGISAMSPLPEALRSHRGLDYWHDGKKLGVLPAMVAAIKAPDGRVVALHRTYLMANARKADVPVVKKVMTGAAGTLAGACIRLNLPARGVLGIAEGIETALAASQAFRMPTVAAYCASALAGFLWPAGVQRLVIFADADKAGREAADTLRVRALAARLHCEVLTPAMEGKDWCDVWAERGAVMIETGGPA